MPDSLDSLNAQLLDAAYDLGDALNREANVDERQGGSTVLARSTAARAKQQIRMLVSEIRRKETG